MGISSGVGLMSGLDIQAIIEATMNAERTPIILLQQKQANFSAKISSYGSLKSSLSALQTTIKALKEPDNYDATYSASSSNKDIATVETTSEATGGTYSLVISQLATSSQMTSNTFADTTTTVGAGMLHFQVGDGDKQSVEIDTSNHSLADIATQINDADTDVSASVLKVGDGDYRLTLTSKNTGEDIDFTYQEAGLTFTTTTQASDSTGEIMRSESFASNTTALGITGSLSVNGTDISLTGTESLDDIQSSIDAIADTTATVELNSQTGEYYLEVESTTAEAQVNLTFEDTDATGGFSELIDATKTQLAEKALININGIDIVRNNNSIDDLITGVTVDLVEADATKTLTVDVSGSYSSMSEKINDFVSAYNEVTKTIDGLQAYNAESGQAGNLLGDSTTNMLQSGLRRMLFSTVDGIDSSVNSLSNLGVTFEESGQLNYESSDFITGITNNKTDVVNFFSQESNSNEGFAVDFDSFLTGYLDSTDGILATKESGYNSSITRMDNTIESMERRLSTKEANLRNQYINLEELMANFTSTSSFLTNQLSVLTNMTNKIYK